MRSEINVHLKRYGINKIRRNLYQPINENTEIQTVANVQINADMHDALQVAFNEVRRKNVTIAIQCPSGDLKLLKWAHPQHSRDISPNYRLQYNWVVRPFLADSTFSKTR